MAKLIMNPHSPSRRDVALPRTLLSIGRDPSNDLVLPDAMVSRRHAVIECRGSHYFLRDCNSSNGSLVNGDRVSERNLRDGDLVAIGAARLLFREELELADSGGKVLQHPSAPRLQCSACQSDYRKGDVFCRQCGARVQEAPAKAVCASCGTAVALPARFCNACGGKLGREEDAPPPGTEPHQRTPEFDPPSAAGGLPAASGPAPAADVPLQAGPQADGAPPEREAAAPIAEPPAEFLEQPAPEPEPGPSASRSSVAPALRSEPERAQHATPTPQPSHARPAPAPRPRVVSMAMRVQEPRRCPDPPEPASAGARLLAALIDVSIVGSAQALLLLPVYLWRPAGPAESTSLTRVLAGVVLVLLALLVAAVYPLYHWSGTGVTPGERAMQLRVEDASGARPLGLARAALRLLGCALSVGALGLGFLPILMGGVGLHDRLARTRVVRHKDS